VTGSQKRARLELDGAPNCSRLLLVASYLTSSGFVCGHPGGGLSGADPPMGGFFEMTNPQRFKCVTMRSATIEAIKRSLSWTRFLPEKSSANAMLPAMS
jgi:hypothetical protein